MHFEQKLLLSDELLASFQYHEDFRTRNEIAQQGTYVRFADLCKC